MLLWIYQCQVFDVHIGLNVHSTIATITKFGFCNYQDSVIEVNPTVTISQVNVAIRGNLRGADNVNVISSAKLDLYAIGKTYLNNPGRKLDEISLKVQKESTISQAQSM